MAKGKFSQPRNRHSEDLPPRQTVPQEPEPYPLPQEEEAVPVTPEEPVPQPAPVPEELESPELSFEESEEYEEEEPTFFEKVGDFVSQNRKVLLVSVCAIVLVAILGVTAVLFLSSAADPYDNLILNNVTIAGVNVGGMTKSEAEEALSAVALRTFAATDMVVVMPEETLTLSPADTGAQLDVKAAVKAAYSYGRTGTDAERNADYEASFRGNHTIGLLPYLELDEIYIRSVLDDYASQYGSVLTQSTYALEGDMPALDAESFSESAPCQTLMITIGTPGIDLDIESIFNDILDAYSLCEFEVKVKDVKPEATPEELDLAAIYDELYIAPVNATVDMQTYEPIPGSYGYGFDLEKAELLVSQAEYGDTIGIPMEYIVPEIMEDGVFFRDVLGECETPHTSNEDRNTNLKLACEAINGVVLNPGEEFSYNDTLGERTKEKGYKPAPSYSGDETVDTYGGGICQVSSTLYYSTLLADMEIVFRVCHGFAPTYIDLGLDATVSWGNPDFKFKNNSSFPIKIEAEVSDGYVKVKILGTDEKSYYVKMENEITSTIPYEVKTEYHPPEDGYYEGQYIQAGVIGYYVRTYRCKYDKATDELISRELEAYSSYKKKDCIKATLIPPETTTPETTPATEATPEETTPATEAAPAETTPVTEAAPVETTAPPTEAPATEAPATEAPATEVAPVVEEPAADGDTAA